MEKLLFRQGDVLVTQVEGELDDLPVVEHDSIVLALGEATGHAHRIEGDVTLRSAGARAGRFLDVGPGGATIVHEEHDAIAVPPGQYEVRTQREHVAQTRTERARSRAVAD